MKKTHKHKGILGQHPISQFHNSTTANLFHEEEVKKAKIVLAAKKADDMFEEGIGIYLDDWDKKNPNATSEERRKMHNAVGSDGDAFMTIIESAFPNEDEEFHQDVWDYAVKKWG